MDLYLIVNQYLVIFFQKKHKKRLQVSKKVVLLHPQSKAIKVLFQVGPVVQLG